MDCEPSQIQLVEADADKILRTRNAEIIYFVNSKLTNPKKCCKYRKAEKRLDDIPFIDILTDETAWRQKRSAEKTIAWSHPCWRCRVCMGKL
jgi:hypothetical protein